MANKNNNNDWRSKVNAMMTDKNYAAKAASVIGDTRSKNLKLMNKSAEDYPALSVGQQSKQPLDLSRVPQMQQEQAARATMPDDDSGVADLAVQAYADARKQIGNEVSKQMADDKSMAFVHPMTAGILRSAESMKAGDVQKTFDRMLENNAVRQAIETKANKELTAVLGKNPALTEEQQKDIYYKSVQRQIGAISNKVNQYLLDVNAPKDEGEYVLKSAFGNSLIGKSMLQAARNISGMESAEYDYGQQALADYDANKAKWWEQGLGIAGGLVLDAPLMQGIGSAANATMGRATMWGLGKAGGKALQASTVGRIATGAAVSSGTLGGYNATSALANQLMEGRFDVGEIASSAGHGFMLGALTGAMSPWLRGVSAGMGKAGKVATMASGLTAEAGIFTGAELAEMENPYDLETIAQVFGKNVAVIGGLKLSNLPKTIGEYKQWYTEGKQSNFSDADYKMMADFARANGYAADDAFTMSADGAYSRSVADRVTGNRTLLTMTKLQGGKEQNLAIEMYNDPNVPLSLKTKIAAKMNLPAPPPVLPNGVRVEGNKAITYYTMSNGQQQVIDIKEFDRPRKARAYANEFSRTTARRNDLLQSEASVNVMMSQPMVVARLNEQAKRNGTTLADEKARMDGILQRAADGTITQEDIAYYRSIVEDDVTTTESLKKDIKDKFGVEIDEVLNKEGNFTAAEDEALTAYGNALRTIIERGNPTTERTATAAMAGIEDYVALNNLGIEQTSAILANPEQRAAIEQQTRSHYAAWLKFFDGKMGEDALAQKLGLDLNNTSDLQTFLAEQTYYKSKAADRIAYNTAEAAKQLLERGDGGVRFLDDGRVKLKGVPFAVEVSEDIVARYEAAKQGSGEPMQRIVNDALKDIIKQSETPAELTEPIAEEMPDVEQPMSEAEAVTQQMVDNRLAEIDTDLQGIEADGIQRVNIDDKPAMIVKGRIAYNSNGEIDRANSSTEVAYIPLDENGRPIKNEQGKPVVEVGVKPSNVRISEVEPWRTIEEYKRAEEQRIRDNNRITDEAIAQVGAEGGEVKEELPTLDKAPIEPKDADELIAMCDGDKGLALDVAVDELAKAQAAKGKGASTAETIDINRRIRTYQQIVDRLSASEMPDATAANVESEQKGEATKAEPQVTDDMEFIYQGLDENHEGMEPMQMADGRYKWVGLQRGELTATMGERDVELLDGLAKKLGVAVIPINVADSAVNGYYRDGNVYVNTNRGADWTMRWVAGHELLHDVAKKSPEAYDAYKQAVLDMWGSDYINDQVKQIIDDYAASGKTIDREQALTELVNDFGGELFNSRDGLSILDNILKGESRKGNTGFVNTIKQWWERLKEWFGGTPYANEVEKKLADAYKEAITKAEEFGRNYDFDYSIIGKRGAANLDKAEEATIRLDNLAVAREMESSGKDVKAIRMATGWERGADNKWRYEIPDELDLDNYGMVLNVAIDKAKWKRAAEKLGRTIESLKSENDNLKAEVERRRMIPSIEKMLADNENTVDSHVRELKKSALLKKLNFYKSGLKYKDSDDVEKMWADLKDSIGKVDVLKLSEVLGADNALFKAYPELADIDVRFDDKGYTSVLATVSNDGKEIWINPHNRESQSSVFLHEIQHLIQKIEGFAKGGSSRMFDIPEEHKYANMPGNIIKSMREQAEFARKKLSQYSTLEEIREYYNANRSWLTGSEKDAIISVMDALMYGKSVEDGISSLEKDYQQAIDDLNWNLTSKDSPYSKYTRLGGEVESRNVQNRMDMTEEERRNTLLSETEDVAREDQILLFSNWDDDLAKEFSISRKIDEKYPNWLEGTTTSSGKHSTQVAGTIGTYRKVGKWIKENLGNDIRILDASSGMGLGTEALRKDGMQIDDVEPYQSEERKKTNPATFSSYKDINGKYDFIISNAVLNVIPDDWRSNVLHDMVARLNNGGRLFINTRKAGEEKTIKDKIELDSPQEILVKRNGKIASYQRFFTPNELKEWVENELGEGYSVEVANEKNSRTKGLAAVVVRKLGEEPTDPNGGGEYSIKSDKQKQFDIISSTNPMRDDYHTGIRKVDDILTLQEAIDASKQENGEDVISTYPDVDESVYNEALQSGKIKVYSSKPIENGAFVGPSRMQAKDYAGGGKVYSKEVNVSDIAWINADEGVYANLGKRADESVLDYAKRVSEENAQPLPAANAKQSKSNSQLSAAQFGLFEDVDFSISRGNRATIEGWLNKRSDLSDKERGAVIDYIDKLNNAQVQLATGKWFASGAIRIPEDMPKVEQAYKVAKKAKVDMLKYASPMELINANSEFKIKEARINPNDVKELKAARSIPQYGIEIFDVEDSQKGQQTMRKIINTHWGKDANPWCLLQGDGEGNLTEDSWEYWNRYNAYPKKVAFKDGKLLAFSANDSEDVVWWDRNDKCHEYIPIVGKVPNDRYGRSALMEIHENGQVDYSNYHIGSENKDGAYMLWSDGGELIQSGFYKDGKFTGWKQLGGYYEMHKDGESYYFDSNSYSDNYRVADANKLVYTKSVSGSGINEYAVKDWGGNSRENEHVTIRKGKIISYRSKKVYFQENEIVKSYRVDDGDVKEIVNRLKTGKKEVTKDDVTYFLNADGTIEKEIHKIPYRSFYAVAYRRPDGNVQHIETIDNRGNRTGWVRYFYTTDGEKRTEPLDKLYNNGYPYNTKVIPSYRIEFDKKWIDIDFIDPKDLNIAIEKTTKDADKYIESRSKAIVDEVESKISKVGNVEAEVEQMKKRDIDALNQKYADYSIKGGNTPERRADEVARLKQRIEQLSQEKNAIAEDVAKVKDIASEMTSFIKQNISTEVQSDMTRNQFKGILNQLENAVTKKDLEKPMQMIEHIGTNVTRRSLTRQMRTFLKSEFKAMTPQGAVKAKTVDGATSRVLELAKTMYATMNKLPLGGEVAALQKQMRDLKADATEWANDQSADTKNLLADVLKVTERPAATRYNELAELRNKVAADGSASGEMLGYIDHMLDIMGDIDYFRGEQQKAKEASALNSKEDLEALKSELLDKSDKGILSEEEKAVLDNMPLYEMMVNLRQQQLDIDGGGAASIDAQIRNKQNAIKAYRAKMSELPKTDTAWRERYKALIEQIGGEIDDLFASRIVDQKAVNNGMRELIDDLVTLKEQGHSRLVEWSKSKQERILDVKQLANNSFSASARGYWDEVNKKGHRLRDINNFLNNVKLTTISPALSFEYMLGTLDKKYYTNDSPIYNRFIKSQDGLLKANDNFFEGLESYNKEVNEAANRLIGRGAITNMAEWFKLGDRFATEEIPFAFEVDQMFDDGTVRKVTKGITATMTRGQAAKIYAWSRMVDGMAKLKAHGVTDETIAAVKDFIGEGYMRFVDWVEDDFFPRLRREKYNPKYKEIYGISMAENEHYFPFAIYKKDVRTNTDLEQIGDDKLGGGLVGNLIERKRNNARLDFTRKSPDIFDMITRYGETMEEWTAYAQVREDLKAMVNDKMFKVKCDMFGTSYYKRFLEAARVASRTSDDKALAGEWNTSMSKLQKVLASAAISMRVSTALKQLLSAPAFAVYSLDPKFLHQLEKTVVPIDVESAIKGLWKIGSGDLQEAKKLLLNENWVGHYNWCVNNLPSFRERVSLGGAGNPILEEKSFDNFFGKLCDAVQSAGMIPNRLVDAFTCSVGAKAVYEYNFNKYKKMYGEKTAHNMAVTEAEIAFNSSQQSSNPVFLSPMQVTKQFFVRGLMNFKNSPIGYLRAGMKANIDMVRAIKSIYNPTFKVDGQEMRFNSNGKNAASMLKTAAVRSAMYNFFLNFIWNFGVYGIAGLSYTAMRNLSGEGNEDGNLLYSDEEWKKATGDNWAATLFLCATQGLPYISGPFATAEQGTEFAPLMLFNTLNEMGTDIYKYGLVSPVTAQWITNLALKNGAGIDPQVCAQVYEGMQGILADRPVTEEDIMNLLASPLSAISGMTKQNVGKYNRLRDYVNARIKSNREIGIDEHMDFGKALAGKRELRKSDLDYYIDEYLEANIPGYREISGRKSKETKQEEQANKKIYEQSMSLVEKIVGTPQGEANEQKASKIDSKDEDIKYMVRRLRDAVAAIHKLYAAGDYSTAEDIATEMQRRIERGYDPNGKTLDERLKNVDIWEPAGKVTQDSPDGYYTNFDRAIGGEFKKMYVGKMNGEGN